VEAMASGLPVIAYGEGGATESVVDGKTGVLFPHQTSESLAEAVRKFEKMTFDPALIRARAELFSEEVFRRRIMEFVSEKWAEFSSGKLAKAKNQNQNKKN
jgi:glycosyltransferase involved in cell wall biosynthesis